MMSSTLGAPFGGTTRGGHHGFESLALCWITPPNLVGGGGSCLPSIVIVALGEPGVPVIVWAIAAGRQLALRRKLNVSNFVVLFMSRFSSGRLNRRTGTMAASLDSHCTLMPARSLMLLNTI